MKALLFLCVCALTGCAEPASLSHEAYVWQRSWNGHVKRAVAEPPKPIGGLRVLVMEVAEDGSVAEPAISVEHLRASARKLTLVARINGSRLPEGLSLDGMWRQAEKLKAAGLPVVGIEVDHDSATAALRQYGRWLAALRQQHTGRLSITALPTWLEEPARLRDVAAQVDELVLQVHAVRAPEIFEARQARKWIAQFSRTLPGTRFRVALPTYRVAVEGAIREAEPRELSAFVRALERHPIPGLSGVLWFRLPVVRDTTAWSAETLSAVIHGRRLESRVEVSLRSAETPLFDVVLRNHGSVDGAWPDLEFNGDAESGDLVAGYVRRGNAFIAPPRTVRPGQEVVVGWLRGRNTHVRLR